MSLSNISRKVCCIISSNSDPLLQNIILDFATETVNGILKKEKHALEKEMRAQLRNMIVKNYTVFEESQILGTHKADELRFVIHDQNQKPEGYSFCKNNSHVVEISTSSIDDVEESSFDYRFYVQNDSFIYLIVDVMLDIQMFHYYGLDKTFNTIEKKREFSLLKVKFCKDLPISGRFNRSNNFTKYCSFAFFCRDTSNKFNYAKYIKMWSEFIANFNNEQALISDKLAKEIIARCKFGAQLSFRKLSNLLNICEKGESYVLVRICKKPKTKNMKKKLCALWGRKKVKLGQIKIIPRRLTYQFIKYTDYIEFFDFFV